MPTCSICYEPFKAPISLPCGHVFCRECIRRTVDSIKSCSIQHWCPTCRVPYSVVTLDPALIPPYLRPHIQPAIRPILLEDSRPSASTSPNAPAVPSASTSTTAASNSCVVDTSAITSPAPSVSPPSDLGRALAELTALRLSCATWRRRAEVHAAANAGLLGFARATKDAAVRMRLERDEARKRCEGLKRKIDEVMPISPPASGSDSEHEYTGASAAAARPHRVGPGGTRMLPAFIRSHRPVEPETETELQESSCFGPPLKRRRGSGSTSISSSPSPRSSPSPVPVEFHDREPPFPGVDIRSSPPPVSNAVKLALPVSDLRTSTPLHSERRVGRVISSSVSSDS